MENKYKFIMASLILLSLIVSLGAAYAEDLSTIEQGEVSGGVDIVYSNPGDGFGELSYDIPEDVKEVQYAGLYVDCYCAGSYNTVYGSEANITMTSNGESEQIANERLVATVGSADGEVYTINDHTSKCFADYYMTYNLTDKLQNVGGKITFNVTTSPIEGYTYYNKIKLIGLVFAYNDGSDDKISYWVNSGSSWIKGDSGETAKSTFNIGKLDKTIEYATIENFALSSVDGIYTFNGEDLTESEDFDEGVYYFKYHKFDVLNEIVNGKNTLVYTPGAGAYSLRNVLSILTLHKEISLEKLIGGAKPGATIDLGNKEYQDVSNVKITKDVTLTGGTIVGSGSADTIFVIAPKSENGPGEVNITGVDFKVNNANTIVKVTGENATDGVSIDVPAINIKGNTIELDSDDVVAESVTVLELDSERPILSPTNAISISGNTITAGVNPFDFKVTSVISGNDISIVPQEIVPTAANATLEVVANDGSVVVTVKDLDGKVIGGANLNLVVNGLKSNRTAGSDGTISIPVSGNATVSVSYSDALGFVVSATVKVVEKTKEVTVPVVPKKIDTVIVYDNMSTTALGPTDGRNGEYFYFTLTDKKGKPIPKVPMQIGFNGKVYDYENNNMSTDEKGVAKLQINLGYKGSYTFAICFLGNDDYNASFAVAVIKVDVQKPKLTVPNKSYAASAKTKTLTATFKTDKGNPIVGKSVKFTVNGKTYSAKTNDKGEAIVKVSLNKKGTYSFTVEYGGDSTYAAVSQKAKLVIK